MLHNQEKALKGNINSPTNNSGAQETFLAEVKEVLESTNSAEMDETTPPKEAISTPGSDVWKSGGFKDITTTELTEINMLQLDNINFPKLQTPTSMKQTTSTPDLSSKSQEPKFVWKPVHIKTPEKKMVEGSRGKVKVMESTPLIRQGYRSGRLAEDFWSAVGMPNTPTSNPKMLRVIPFLTKNRNTELIEYLVDRRGKSFGAIAFVHIAEVLAGIPWTQVRARQHIVNEVSLTLHKILIFNNNLSNPFQKWNQGRWYSQWGQGTEGEYICTLFVSIDVPEHKVKPRKGLHMGWRREPREISSLLTSQMT